MINITLSRLQTHPNISQMSHTCTTPNDHDVNKKIVCCSEKKPNFRDINIQLSTWKVTIVKVLHKKHKFPAISLDTVQRFHAGQLGHCYRSTYVCVYVVVAVLKIA